LGSFLIQIGIFILLALLISLLLKRLGKYGVFFSIAVALGSLLLAVIVFKDFSDRYLWFILLFGIIALSGVIRQIIKTKS
jgi:low temperature requirement protein LtrA